MIQLSHAEPLPFAAHEVLLVGPDGRRLARLARVLKPYGFDMKPVVYSPGPFGARVPEAAPRVIVAEAAPPVTVRHYDRLLLLWQRWERIPCIAVTGTRDSRVLAAFRTLGVGEFASDSNGGSDIAARLWRHLGDANAAAPDGEDTQRRLCCDAVRHTVSANGRSVPLTTREFELYSCLSRRPNVPVAHSEIVRSVWGRQTLSRSSAVAVGVYVFHLRRKLAVLGLEHALRTARGTGYMLVDPGTMERPRQAG